MIPSSAHGDWGPPVSRKSAEKSPGHDCNFYGYKSRVI